MTAKPNFYVVYAARPGSDNFTIEGIFSKHEDAEALRSYLQKDVANTTAITFAPMREILDHLAKERLGELAEPLRELLAWVNGNNSQKATENRK